MHAPRRTPSRAAAALALLLSLVPVARAAEPAAAPPPTVKVKLVEASQATSAPWVAASLAPARRATLSTRLAASVRAIPVEEGQQVAAGQVLVRLADEDVRAGLAAAETARDTADRNAKRFQALLAQKAALPVELEMAEAQRAQAAAQVEAAKANLSYTEIRAPFAGTVQARRASAGDLVGPGQPLVDLEGGGLELQASLSEEEASRLAVGKELRFRAGDREGKAKVTALSPGGDPLSHRRTLRALVTAGAAGLRSGSFARLELPAGTPVAGGVTVPRSALVRRGDLTGVFVAEGSRAHLRWIALGEPAGDRLAVRAGLRSTDAVIDAPGALVDGQAIEVSRER